MLKKRYALIPACISFGPMAISRMGGTMPDDPAYGPMAVVIAGVVLLTAGLHLMFQFQMEQHMAIEELRKEQKEISNT